MCRGVGPEGRWVVGRAVKVLRGVEPESRWIVGSTVRLLLGQGDESLCFGLGSHLDPMSRCQ